MEALIDPGWTGPSEDRRAYRVDNRRAWRRGGLGVVYKAVLETDRLSPPGRGGLVALKLLTGVDEERFAKLRERSPRLAEVKHAGLATHLEVFVGPPVSSELLDETESDQWFSANVWVEGPLPRHSSSNGGGRSRMRWIIFTMMQPAPLLIATFILVT
jgi:hypothetical protein